MNAALPGDLHAGVYLGALLDAEDVAELARLVGDAVVRGSTGELTEEELHRLLAELAPVCLDARVAGLCREGAIECFATAVEDRFAAGEVLAGERPPTTIGRGDRTHDC